MTNISYQEYIQSDRWKQRRDRYYWSQGGPSGYVCCVRGCGVRKNLHLHHLTYEHLGNERTWELCFLCPDCHKLYHEGKVTITVMEPYKFLFWKSRRAKRYRA
jgi:5-methylcytosine-specific restriction endonuclease McrA